MTGSGGAAKTGGTTGAGGATASGGSMAGSGGATGGATATPNGGAIGGGNTGSSGGAPGTGGRTTASGGTTTATSGTTTATGGTTTAAGGRTTATGGTTTATGGTTRATGGTTTATGGTGGGSSGPTIDTTGITCAPQTWDAAPIGWATVSGSTTGGGNGTPVVVSSLSAFNSAAGGSSAAVIHVSGTISGTVNVGSNKTIWGLCGAKLVGTLDMSGSSNVIVRNLTIATSSNSTNDAVHVQGGDQHLWFDHLDISDGPDGNMDLTHAVDFVTVSWTKFHYTSSTAAHRFCNLIGHDDGNGAEDTGKLNMTFHHVWWADNVDQRMPRVRFGKVHLFNNLYTAAGDSAAIEVGVSCNIRSENNDLRGVSNPVDSTHSDSASIYQSIGNLGSSTQIGGSAFTPPYTYTLEAASSVDATVRAGAGVK